MEESTDEQREHEHEEKWLQNGPDRSENRLPVANLEIAPDDEVEDAPKITAVPKSGGPAGTCLDPHPARLGRTGSIGTNCDLRIPVLRMRNALARRYARLSLLIEVSRFGHRSDLQRT